MTSSWDEWYDTYRHAIIWPTGWNKMIYTTLHIAIQYKTVHYRNTRHVMSWHMVWRDMWHDMIWSVPICRWGAVSDFKLSFNLTLHKSCLNFWLKSEIRLKSQTAPHPMIWSKLWSGIKHSKLLQWRHFSIMETKITRKSTVCSTACSDWHLSWY